MAELRGTNDVPDPIGATMDDAAPASRDSERLDPSEGSTESTTDTA